MVVEGIVEDGWVKLDDGAAFRNGTRVRVAEGPRTESDESDESDESELALLCEGVKDSQTGRFRPLCDVVTDVTAHLGLPAIPFDKSSHVAR